MGFDEATDCHSTDPLFLHLLNLQGFGPGSGFSCVLCLREKYDHALFLFWMGIQKKQKMGRESGGWNP